MSDPDASLSYCGQEVRRYDNDRFLTCLFAPADRRESLFALYAFNQEIAKTREVVTEPLLGQIRLQWWQDSIENVYGGTVPRHEILLPLAEAIERHGLSREHFETLIVGREADLIDEAPPDMAALEHYAAETSVPLVLLALEALGVRDDTAAAAGRHVGLAWALTGLLRALPFHASRHRLYLPQDALSRQEVSSARLFDFKPQPGLNAVVREVADRARDHLSEARALRSGVPRAALPALLTAPLADLYLGAIAKADHDVFAPRVQMPHPFRQIRLGWAALVGRY
jgi:NADH dehydrogenase [ubiquinone] 1 alpha subcomplex assembly factor 6